MQKCWSPLPKDRPTFEQLSNALRDLEHNKKRYVNLDTLLEQAIRGNDIFAHLKIKSSTSSHEYVYRTRKRCAHAQFCLLHRLSNFRH